MKMCKSHITLLRKVSTQLAYKQTMSHSKMLLGLDNRNKLEKAEQLIYEAMNLLAKIE